MIDKQTKEGRFVVGIGAIIENENTGKILLLRRSTTVDFAKNIWDNIGGRMFHFETPEDTLRREIKEETGITEITINKPIDVSHYFRGDMKKENEMIVITYWCKTPIQDILLSSEHEEFRWIDPKTMIPKLIDENVKQTILKFIKEKNKVNLSFY